ncbi:hypothetical protein SynNOUM97013_01018 [Synechococcus sp. NOUM97013]|nr:hypothetical protein SynNOUM97013_01018 [Synechococcus sp. NOUM97013]
MQISKTSNQRDALSMLEQRRYLSKTKDSDWDQVFISARTSKNIRGQTTILAYQLI